ncbi:MAG TPA: hypothetical protein VFY40_18535 [Blastocatellia bacterium]|nr:hypothetical protein [Blastocatellia bacterium]
MIPENFERDFLRGRQAEAQWLIYAVDANTANNMRGQAKEYGLHLQRIYGVSLTCQGNAIVGGDRTEMVIGRVRECAAR